MGTLKSVGRIYQQTIVDTYFKWATVKLCTTKASITAADLLNYRILPFFASQLEEGNARLRKNEWAQKHGIGLEHSRPGTPTDNGFVESFNGSLRDECLNQNIFVTFS